MAASAFDIEVSAVSAAGEIPGAGKQVAVQAVLLSAQGAPLVQLAFVTPVDDAPRVGEAYTITIAKKGAKIQSGGPTSL